MPRSALLLLSVEIADEKVERPAGQRVWQIEQRQDLGILLDERFFYKERGRERGVPRRVMRRVCALCCLALCCFRSEWNGGFRDGARTADKVDRENPPSVTSSAAHSSPSFLPRSALLTVINAANTRGRPLSAGKRAATRGGFAIIYKLAPTASVVAFPIGREID